MKKVLFLLSFFILTAADTAVVSVVLRDDDNIEMPVADNEETRDVSEDDDDDVSIDHLWISKEKSSSSNLHVLYQGILFSDLEIEVIVPPPKG